jgi:predicted transposase/invertase (TIGR01784 family)
MARYLYPQSDITFWKVFGKHPELVKSFLNALLPLPEGQSIVDITYLTLGQFPDTPGKGKSSVSVKCVESTGRVFIVEIQNFWGHPFKNKIVLNDSKAYARPPLKGGKYSLAQPVYTLAVIKETYTPGVGYYHHYTTVCMENSDEVIEGLQLVLVELPKFVPETTDEKKMRVLWLRFLKEVGEDVNILDTVLMDDPHIKEAVEICEIWKYTPGELEAYDIYWDAVSMDRTVQEALAEKNKLLAEKTRALAEKDKALENERLEQERITQALAENQKLIEALQKQ